MARVNLLSMILVVISTSVASAQQNTTVQLPTLNVSTVNTTVSVPDGGTALLGGIMRAAEGSTSRGVPLLSNIPYLNRLFKNRGIGRDVSASNFTVTPRIIILEEEEMRQTGMTAETLSQMTDFSAAHQAIGQTAHWSPRGQAAPSMAPAASRKAAFLAANVARHLQAVPATQTGRKLPSVEEIRQRNALAQAQRTAEAAEFFGKGRQAESEGKVAVAKVFYQMAARRAEGDLQGQVAARLAAIEAGSKTPQLAAR